MGKVKVIGVLHGIHMDSRACSYEHLYEFVEKYQPEVLCLEIRQIDIGMPEEYLRRNYHYEMVELYHRFANKALIKGVDWLGAEIEHEVIPYTYFETWKFKTLERAFEKDAKFAIQRSCLNTIDESRLELITNRTLEEINDGKYDAVSRIYYRLFRELVVKTEYEPLIQGYEQRSLEIAKRVEAVMEQYPTKSILVVVGLDLRSYIQDYFTNKGRIVL